MSVHFISINTIINIPSVRFIVQFFVEKYNKPVIITERALKNQNNYFENNNMVIFDNLEEYTSETEYKNQSAIRKLKKYLLLIQKIFRLLKTKEQSVIISPDIQVLYFLFLLKKFLPKNKNKVIYIQFELVNLSYLGKINRYMYKRVVKRSKNIDLAIFPEINRLRYFIDSCINPPKECFVLPNTCKQIENHTPKRHKIFNDIPKDAFIIGHVGNVGGENHYFNELIAVAEKCCDKNIYFIFLGRQSSDIKQKKTTIINQKILFFEKVPHQELVNIYPFFNLGIILYKGISPNYEFAAPNKLYEFWAYGIPVIAHSLKGLQNVFIENFLGTLTNMDDHDKFYQDVLENYQTINKPSEEIKAYFNNKVEISIFLNDLDNCINKLN